MARSRENVSSSLFIWKSRHKYVELIPKFSLNWHNCRHVVSLLLSHTIINYFLFLAGDVKHFKIEKIFPRKSISCEVIVFQFLEMKLQIVHYGHWFHSPIFWRRDRSCRGHLPSNNFTHFSLCSTLRFMSDIWLKTLIHYSGWADHFSSLVRLISHPRTHSTAQASPITWLRLIDR